MNQYATPENIKVKIEGNISGQLAIGNNILQIGDVHGGIVNVIAPEKKPNYSKRNLPVYLRPRAFPGFLDREGEQKAAIGVLRVSESLSITGENGIGKTAFLRYLAYNSPGDNFPDGIIYISARGTSLEDLLQNIFETFYESDSVSKPTDMQLRRFLQDLKALIILDDLTLEYADATQLINGVPQCTFILSSSEQCLWGEGHCIELNGLPEKDAVLLLERELGRALSEQELPAARTFCQKVQGHPLYIIQGTALTHHGVSFADLANKLQESEDTFVKDILFKLSDSQRQLLSLLAVSGGFPIPIHHLESMSHIKDMDHILKTLLDLRLIQAHSPAYSLTGSLAFSLGRITDLKDWESRFQNYFVQWIKQNPPLPDITDVLNLLLSLLEKNNREHRWDDVISLGRGIEKTLVLSKRWSAWARVLEMILNAAQQLGNRSMQSWALHQIGTRQLCMENLDAARQSLSEALKIREALGDKAGAAITRHNLNLTLAPPAPPRSTPRSGPKPAPKGGTSPILKTFFTLLTVAAVVAVAIFVLSNLPETPSPVNPVPVNTKSNIQPPIVIKSPTKIPTKVPTKIPTKTFTPSPALQPCEYGVWYCENFNDDEAQFWYQEGYWIVQNGVLDGSEHYFATLSEHSWDDYRVIFDLKINAGTIHLNYRLSPGQNGLNRYFIGVDQNGISLNRQNNESFTNLAYANFYYPPNEWHHIEIAGWGGHLRVYVDGQMQIEYIDYDYISSGTIAFETLDHSYAQIDNIEVTGSGDEPAIEPVYEPDNPVPYNPVPNNPAPAEQPPVFIITYVPLPISCTSTYMTWEESTDRPGMDYWSGTYTGGIDSIQISAKKCQQMCQEDSSCMAFTYDNNLKQCWLKNGKPDPVYKYEDISGTKECQ